MALSWFKPCHHQCKYTSIKFMFYYLILLQNQIYNRHIFFIKKSYAFNFSADISNLGYHSNIKITGTLCML